MAGGFLRSGLFGFLLRLLQHLLRAIGRRRSGQRRHGAQHRIGCTARGTAVGHAERDGTRIALRGDLRERELRLFNHLADAGRRLAGLALDSLGHFVEMAGLPW